MTTPRLALVTRRFWPLVGGAEVAMARLAEEFQRRGVSTTLLTARWRDEWPREIVHRGVRVVRLRQPAGRFLGTLAYMRGLGRWLRDHRDEFDLAYVSMLKHDAYAAVGAGRRGRFPVVLRAEGGGATGDVAWQRGDRFGRLIARRCRAADAIVAISPAIRAELLGAGYDAARIRDIPNGVAIPPLTTPEGRRAARIALFDAHSDMATTSATQIALYTGRLHASKGLATLVAAWPQVVAACPAARLWLVGEGPQRAALVRQVKDLGLSGQVALPGAFDDVDDFLRAADVFVLPSYEEGVSLAMLEAMAAGLPVVASDIEANRAVAADGVHVRLAPAGDVDRFAAAIVAALCDPAGSAAMCSAARRRVAERFSLAATADAHLDLFERLLTGRRGP